MAEAQVGETSPEGKDAAGKREINVSASKESEDDRDDTSAELHCDDSGNTEGNTRSAQNSSEIAIWKNKEFISDSASQGGSGSEGDIREQKDLASGGNCQSSTCSLNGEENKENLCVAVVLEQTLTDPSASPETEEEGSKRPNPTLERADTLKIATNAPLSQTTRSEEEDWVRQVQAEGRVGVVFPGSVTQDACCRFVCEILKCVLYLRQQLPMTYDQLVLFHRKQQALSRSEEVVGRRPVKSGGWDLRKSQRTLQELEEVLAHLEVLFSLSPVPRVLVLLGGTSTLPAEAYEINMEDLTTSGSAPRVLRTSVCLRQLFRHLFLADFLSDARPVRLLATSVLAMAHRNCGVAWFRPRLDYRVPTRPKRRIIALSCDPSVTGPQRSGPTEVTSDDYIWFQAPVTIKGFCK